MPETVVIKYPEGRYEGEVNADGEPEGEGILEFPGNDEHERMIYEGEFKAKKAHGKGLMKWREGDRYDGQWKDGLRHGQGTYFSKASGGKYEGEYVNDVKNGKGKYTYPNGDVYNGEWKDGKKNGRGVYKYKEDGGVYDGEWRDGLKQGKGKFTFASNDVFEGTYDNNERHGEGFLSKADGEKRQENWKLGKLVNFQIVS